MSEEEKEQYASEVPMFFVSGSFTLLANDMVGALKKLNRSGFKFEQINIHRAYKSPSWPLLMGGIGTADMKMREEAK